MPVLKIKLSQEQFKSQFQVYYDKYRQEFQELVRKEKLIIAAQNKKKKQ